MTDVAIPTMHSCNQVLMRQRLLNDSPSAALSLSSSVSDECLASRQSKVSLTVTQTSGLRLMVLKFAKVA